MSHKNSPDIWDGQYGILISLSGAEINFGRNYKEIPTPNEPKLHKDCEIIEVPQELKVAV